MFSLSNLLKGERKEKKAKRLLEEGMQKVKGPRKSKRRKERWQKDNKGIGKKEKDCSVAC
jgi:hypothetical protein